MHRFFVSAVLLGVTSGCSYQTAVDVSPAYDVYSSYSNAVPGSWALLTDASGFNGQRIKFSGYNCSAHNFPLDMGDAFSQSVVKTLENVFENIQRVNAPIPSAELARSGFSGMIIVRAEDLDADLNVIPGFFSGEADAEIELAVSVTIDGPSGRLFGTTVSEDGEHRNGLGSMCDGGGTALGRAAGEATQNTLQRLAERISNAPRIRELEI